MSEFPFEAGASHTRKASSAETMVTTGRPGFSGTSKKYQTSYYIQAIVLQGATSDREWQNFHCESILMIGLESQIDPKM